MSAFRLLLTTLLLSLTAGVTQAQLIDGEGGPAVLSLLRPSLQTTSGVEPPAEPDAEIARLPASESVNSKHRLLVSRRLLSVGLGITAGVVANAAFWSAAIHGYDASARTLLRFSGLAGGLGLSLAIAGGCMRSNVPETLKGSGERSRFFLFGVLISLATIAVGTPLMVATELSGS